MQIEGLVQLQSGDAVRGIVGRLRWPWRYIRIHGATAFSAQTGDGSPVDGVVWIPKRNVLYVQELVQAPALNITVPVKVTAPVTVLTPGGMVSDE